MTCGWTPFAKQSAPKKCVVAAGQNVGVSWYHGWSDGAYVSDSHYGVIHVYMAKSDTGAGNVWFKVFQAAILELDSTGEAIWASPTLLNRNNGIVYFNIPSDITAGNYLVRGELMSLHGVGDYHGIQTYVRCAEITVTGGGSKNPSGVSFPGAYSYSDPGVTFYPYEYKSNPRPYVHPGPAVYVAGSVTPPPSPPSSPPPSTVPPPSNPIPPPSPTPSTNDGSIVIDVLITAVLGSNYQTVNIMLFVQEILDVLSLPNGAIKNVLVDMDKSTKTGGTVIEFTITNFKKSDGTYVDPMAVARSLQEKVANNAPELQNTQYLSNMKVEVEELSNSSSNIQYFGMLIATLVSFFAMF